MVWRLALHGRRLHTTAPPPGSVQQARPGRFLLVFPAKFVDPMVSDSPKFLDVTDFSRCDHSKSALILITAKSSLSHLCQLEVRVTDVSDDVVVIIPTMTFHRSCDSSNGKVTGTALLTAAG